ncbi:MAG: zeta toxin family protein [Ferruginibacter sp.]
MANLFIIAGCNGAGKTTASFTILPELLRVKEFVNADEIARGLSPFQPEKISIQAGKIMLRRLQELFSHGGDFAFETTLSSRSFIGIIRQAKDLGYTVNLIYYWLDSIELAIKRVKIRVSEGGHGIPDEVIIRRYYAGLKNFLNLYKDKVDYWMLIDNSQMSPRLIAEGEVTSSVRIVDKNTWDIVNKQISETDRNKR